MHKCKTTRNSLIELVFDELPPAHRKSLHAELEQCAACREEYAALRNLLRVARQELRSGLPAEDFWSGYHSRLRRRIVSSAATIPEAESFQAAMLAQLKTILKRIATATVRVPVPVAAVFVLFFGLATLFAMHSRRGANVTLTTSAPPSETRTVEVPVIHEKVLTRIVYVQARRLRGALAQPERTDTAMPVSGAAPKAVDKTAVSLAGFKPPEHVKLTIIKGSYQDDK